METKSVESIEIGKKLYTKPTLEKREELAEVVEGTLVISGVPLPD